MTPGLSRLFAIGSAIAAAYVVAAQLGFQLAFAAEQVTTVWAPTGIAQAALLLWGVRLWPGVWAGAFLANAFSDAPLWTAGAIATGNTLEAVALVWLLGRTRFEPSLSRVNDAARFVLFGAVLVTAISATIGVTTLCAAGVQPWHRFANLWSAWWVGDALGSLVIAPVIVTAARPVHKRTARGWAGVLVTMAASAALAAIVFGGGAGSTAGNGPLHYVLFPFVIAAAVLVGQPATALAVFVASAVAIINTVAGRGPFSAPDAGSGLILLQIFTGVLASTALLLCAAITERQIVQSHMRAVLDTALDAEERLRASQQQLRDADRRKDEFLAMLAHELRNPLAPIRTGLENLRLAGDSPEMVRRLRPIMERQIDHMVRLIDDLLDVSRITSGKILLQRQRVGLRELVQAAVDANRHALDVSGAALVINLPEGPVELFVDPTRFIQVVSNLVNNAAKFTGRGGRITIAGAVAVANDARELQLSVADTGSGIDSELLPHVFELFTQGESSTAGLGVGLALAERIMTLHGGTVDAHSRGPGHGSEFRIRIPITSAPPAPAEHATASPGAGSPIERRVLVVDDNADAADMIAWLVKSLGGEARVAHDGSSALRLAAEFRPDLVLLDIGMQGMDGYDTCRALRQQSDEPQPFIVALTGWGQDRDKARAADAGFDMHLTKPADPSVLEEILRDPTLLRGARRSN